MKIYSKRVGEIEFYKEEAIFFPDGLVGFALYQKFGLIDLEEWQPFKLFQSLDDPDLAFCIVEPSYFFSDYHFTLVPKEIEVLKANSMEEIRTFVILSFRHNPFRVTANLQGPLLVNPIERLGRQIVLKHSPYHTQHVLLEDHHD